MKFILIYVIVLLALLANEVLSKPAHSKKEKKHKKQKPKSGAVGTKGFCKGKTLSDGTQIRGGSCSTTIQGDIPASNKMTSTLIISPANEEILASNKTFRVKVFIENLETGHFSDPKTVYNAGPQELNGAGFIKGHTHVTIQQLNGFRPPNAGNFEFFKGLNDEAEHGLLVVDVVREDGSPGLPAGKYRICTMSGSFTHQPLVMPIAQRGAQDDCIRITVKQDGEQDEKSKNKVKKEH